MAAILRLRPPRHRVDPRPGALEHDPGTMGTLSASLLVYALCAAAVLTISAVHLWARQRDPLVVTVVSGQPAAFIGTISQQSRVSVTSRSTLVITTLDVVQMDAWASTLSAIILGDTWWLSPSMGTRIRARTRLHPTEARHAEAAIIPKRTGLTALSPPSGVFGAVTSVCAGLAQVIGAPGVGALGVVGTGEKAGLWLPGAHGLAPGVTLGDDHTLSTPLCEDMRTVSMAHLTAVSGQHVAIVPGLGLEVLGAPPRRWRALLGAVMLIFLVILVHPSGSVLCAATVGAIILLGAVAGRRATSMSALCAGAVVSLLIDPWQPHDCDFTLSVAAIAGTVIGSKPVAAHLSRRLPRWLVAAVVLLLVAQAARGPIPTLLQPSMGAWSMSANLFGESAVVVVTISGLLAALIVLAWPVAATIIAWPAFATCSWMAWVAGLFAHLPGAALSWPDGLTGAPALRACEIGVLIAAAPRARRALLEEAGRPRQPARDRLISRQ